MRSMPRHGFSGFRSVASDNNAVHNTTMQGAVVGTPGTIPTTWILAAMGLSTSVVGLGSENGVQYIEYRFFGTTSGAGSFQFYMDATTAIPAVNGQTWENSFFLSMTAGSTANISQIRSAIDIRSGGGAFSSTVSGTDIKASLTSTMKKFTQQATLADAATATVMPIVQFVIAGAVAIDITVRIGLPKLKRFYWIS